MGAGAGVRGDGVVETLSTPPQGDAYSSAGADGKGETFVPSPRHVTKDPQTKKNTVTPSHLQQT